jgi:hypothetical protein
VADDVHMCTYDFVGAKYAQEPHCPRNCHVIRLEQIQQIVTFGAVRDTLAKLLKRNVRVGEVSEPGLTFGIVQGDAGRHSE